MNCEGLCLLLTPELKTGDDSRIRALLCRGNNGACRGMGGGGSNQAPVADGPLAIEYVNSFSAAFSSVLFSSSLS